MPPPIRLIVIPPPDPNARTIIDYRGEGTVVFRATNPDAPDLACGECEAILATGWPRSGLTNIVIRCNNCGAYNDTPDISAN